MRSLRVYAPLLLVLVTWPWLYLFVCDDAYISFRYCRNLLLGHGLVFNPGEYVEGYTNLLWVLELAGIWGLTGIRPEVASVPLSWLYTLGTAWLVVRMALRTPFRGWEKAIAWAALAMWVTNRSVAVWTTSGLETRQFTFFVTLGLYALTRWRDGRPWLVLGSTAYGLALLTRPEALLLGPAAIAWFGWDAWRQRRLTLGSLLEVSMPFAAITVSQFVWRFLTYGELLPNTYYAKAVRPWWDAGATYLAVAGVEHALWWVLPLAILGTWARWGRGDAAHVAIWLWLIPDALHLARIGGDHFEFRMLDTWWPVLYVAAADGIAWIAARQGRAGLDPARWGKGLLGATVAIGLAIPVAHDIQAFQRRGYTETSKLAVEITPWNSPWVYLIPPNLLWIDRYNAASRWLADHSIATRARTHQGFAALMVGWYGPYGAWEGADLFPADALAATAAIGAYSYFLPDVPVVDRQGLTDHTIARTPVTRTDEQRRLAHDRRPPEGYLEARGVNLDVRPFERTLLAGLGRAQVVVQLGPEAFMPLRDTAPGWAEEAFPRHEVHRLADHADALRPGGPPAREPTTRFTHGVVEWGVDRWLGRFDGEDEGWTVAGDHRVMLPVGGTRIAQARVRGFEGASLVNSWHPVDRDEPKGTLRSPSFEAEANQALTFLVGGGDRDELGVFLLADGTVVGSWRGKRDQKLRRVVVPLERWAGSSLAVEIRDHSGKGWGHVLADAVSLVSPIAEEMR